MRNINNIIDTFISYNIYYFIKKYTMKVFSFNNLTVVDLGFFLEGCLKIFHIIIYDIHNFVNTIFKV